MDKFTTLTGVAAPLPMINVDTDKIIPKQHLKTVERTGLGKALFEELLGCGVGDGADSHVGGGQPGRLADLSGHAEVGEQNAAGAGIGGFGEQDVGGFDVAVQHASHMGVVECTRDSVDDRRVAAAPAQMRGRPTHESLFDLRDAWRGASGLDVPRP